MAGFWEKIVSTLGFDVEEYEEDDLKEERKETVFHGRRDNVVALQQKNRSMKMVLLHPADFEQVKVICDHLKGSRTVILNMEETSKEDARRILDFVSGAVYTIGGGIQKVSINVFLLTPANVEVNADTLEQIYTRGMFPWNRSN